MTSASSSFLLFPLFPCYNIGNTMRRFYILDREVRFDMSKRPVKCGPFFKLLLWILCFPSLLAHRTKLKKIGMDGVRGPYLLLGNHNAFFDMKVSIAAGSPELHRRHRRFHRQRMAAARHRMHLQTEIHERSPADPSDAPRCETGRDRRSVPGSPLFSLRNHRSSSGSTGQSLQDAERSRRHASLPRTSYQPSVLEHPKGT